MLDPTGMAAVEFTGLVRPSPSRHGDQFDTVSVGSSFFIKDAFTLRTLLLLGAIVQIVLTLILPPRVAFLPAGLAALYAIMTTAVQTACSPRNSFMRSVIIGRASTQLPDPDSSHFGEQPAVRSIVVFHFGVRFSHPLGVLCPGGLATLAHFNACNDSIVARADNYGMLGLSPWRAAEQGSNNSLMMVYYFRDVEGLNRFAHDELHRKAWDWIVKTDYKHIGFFHEAFCVPKSAYESIYVNTPPLLMGQTSVKCVDKEGQETWVRPVVSADVRALRSQFGRMGRAFNALNE